MKSDSEGEEIVIIEYCCCCSAPIKQNENIEEKQNTVKTNARIDIEVPISLKDGNIDTKLTQTESEKAEIKKHEENTIKKPTLSSSSVADIHILATIFEYPYIIREQNTVFETETEEFGICHKCDSVLAQLYPMYLTFTELLKHDGRIWRILQKIGKEQEPILPMLVYDDSNDEANQDQDQEDIDYVDDNDLDNDQDQDQDFGDNVNEKGGNLVGHMSTKTRRRRPRKLPPKRISARVIHSDSEERDENQTSLLLKKNRKVQNSSRKTSNTIGRAKPIRKRKPKQQYSSEEISDDNEDESFNELGDPDDEDFVCSDVEEFDKPTNTTECESGNPEISGEASALHDGSSSTNYTNDDPSGDNPGTRKLRGRSIKITENPLVENKKDFKAFVEGIRKKAKVQATAKAKAKAKSKRTGPKMKPGPKPKLGPKKPRIRKKDTRIRIRKSRQECWSEVKEGDPTRTCDVCGKLFLFPRLMNHHKITVHEGQKPYECKSCGKGFTQKFILKKHLCDYSQLPENERDFLILEREAKLRNFLCDHCGKKFKGRAQLVLHLQNHRDDRPFKCEKCTKTFRRHDHLKKHMKAVHTNGQRFVCSICGQTFKIQSSLRAHEKRHNSPKETHVCTICGKSFDSILVVRRHQMTHDETLPFQCEICGKRFKMKDYLGQHLRKGKSCKPGMAPKIPKSHSGSQNPNQSQQEHNSTKNSNNSNIYNENMSSISLGSSASTASAGVSNDNLSQELPRATGLSLGHGHGSNVGHSQGHGSTTSHHSHGPGPSLGSAPCPVNPAGPSHHMTQMMDFSFGQLFDNRSSMTEL